jgi:hypothetical protein
MVKTLTAPYVRPESVMDPDSMIRILTDAGYIINHHHLH